MTVWNEAVHSKRRHSRHMQRPMPIILAVLVIAGIALGFLSHSFDPFTASAGIKALFLVVVFMLIVSCSLIILYAAAVVAHNGLRYFVARYFGPEAPYFKSMFQSSVLIALAIMLVVGLRKFGLLPWK